MTRLPEFDRPPLVELALTVQFEQIEQLDNIRAGLFWNDHRDQFPGVEEHELIDTPLEVEGSAAHGLQFKLELRGSPRMPRFFFLKQGGKELLQLQNNRFSHNWRKRDGDQYPRYDKIRPSFEKELVGFGKFLEREGLGTLIPTQVEISYVNHIASPESAELPHVSDILKLWPGSYTRVAGTDFEDVGFNARHIIRNERGEFCGRFHV
jgi:uncharacterized protein (TIGR04255 family)